MATAFRAEGGRRIQNGQLAHFRTARHRSRGGWAGPPRPVLPMPSVTRECCVTAKPANLAAVGGTSDGPEVAEWWSRLSRSRWSRGPDENPESFRVQMARDPEYMTTVEVRVHGRKRADVFHLENGPGSWPGLCLCRSREDVRRPRRRSSNEADICSVVLALRPAR